MSHLLAHAERELTRAGLAGTEDAEMVMMLMEALVKSGAASHLLAKKMTLEKFNLLANFKTLTPITSNPDEWQDVSKHSGYPHWQNLRDPSVFPPSWEKTWKSVDEGDDDAPKT